MHRTRLIAALPLLALAACDGSSPAAAAVDAAAEVTPADGSALTDLGVAAPDAPSTPPYDAGPAPACARTAVLRRIATRSEGVRDLTVGGLSPYRGGFVVAALQSAARGAPGDGSLARRDTVDVAAFDHDAMLQRPLEPVYASAPAGTDLTTPALAPLGEGAVALFAESRGRVGEPDFALRLRGSLLDNGAAPGVPAVLQEQHGEALVAPLPDGQALVISSRVRSVTDAGVVVVSPMSFRLDREGRLSTGLDVTAFVRLDAESVLLRPARDGAVLYSRVGADLIQLGFDGAGRPEGRGARRTAGLGADRFDDAAAIGDVSVVAWGAQEGDMGVVRAAVVRRDGTLIARRELDRFRGADPIVGVAPAWGGAAVAWLRGVGDTITIRATVVQPDGVVRGDARDLVRAPNADGRLVVTGVEGSRVVTFAVRDTDGLGAQGLSVGRACLP